MENQEYKLLYEGYLEWISRINYADQTQKIQRRHLRIFLEWLEMEAIESLEEIEQADLQLFKDYLFTCKTKNGKALAKTTIRARFNIIKIFNTYLEHFDKAPISVRPLVRFPKEYKVPKILTREEIKHLYDACENNERGLRNRVILTLYYGCGLRLGEGLNLLLDDVDVKNGWVQIRKGKYYLERFVPLTETGKSDIAAYLKYGRWFFLNGASDLLLLNNNGEKIKDSTISKIVKTLARKAEITKRVYTHLLRHSIATHLLENGMDLEQIQLFLGHRHLISTQIYTHIVESKT